MMPVALQLWSVKDVCEKDFFGTLEKVSEMGYDGIEFAGYYNESAQNIKEKCTELGLQIVASHIPAEKILNDLDNVISFEKELGNNYIVCPYASYDTKDEWKSFASKLNVACKKIEDAGMTLVYHNHHHEFHKLEDTYILDYLLEMVPHLKAELDTYWIQYAGVDVVSYMSQYDNRTPFIHLKDMKKEPMESTEIGKGVLDITRFVKQAENQGVEWLIIEQEAFTKPSLESVEIGLINLKQLIGGD
ncbi:sugar phosphate isomerase/epimerase family protein [Terrilactibacillus laevilacticus]|uniref:Sugar phosphate isomerase/epimerase family protein n=1 Tax=Terrilactibacillus laevilacticus TaxID=1380157 RepID=A0ABW5PM41_9BACI|nr:sugar phosphate isomerase/epimerase family protein [Terrilactibacillus laevilacticus]